MAIYSAIYSGVAAGAVMYYVIGDESEIEWVDLAILVVAAIIVLLIVICIELSFEDFSNPDGTPYGDATRIENPQFYRAGQAPTGETKWIVMDPKYHPEASSKFAVVIPDRVTSIA